MGDAPAAFRNPLRWAILAIYVVIVALSQLLWLNFAPILTQIQARYGVDELTASLLVLVFPLLYVLLSLPAGRFVDTRGYRLAIGGGGFVMSAFAALRIYDDSFWILLAGQIGIAVAQPFIVNGISKLVVDWFDPQQGAIATGLGTMGMFIGMAAGLAATPPLVTSFGLRGAMAVFAAITLVASIVFWVVVRSNPAAPPAEAPATTGGELRSLLRDRRLVVLFALALFGLGEFNGLTTWLEEILKPQGFDSEGAGLAGGVLVLGGIIGAVVIPSLSDKLRRRKPFVILCSAGGLATLYPLCTSADQTIVLVFAALHGFFLLPALALLLDMSARLAGPARAGSATGLLMLVGNAGGVVVPIAMQAARGDAKTFQSGVYMLLGVLAALVMTSFGATETATENTAS